MIEFYAAIFAGFLCSFGPPSRALGTYTPREGWDALHDGVGINCKYGASTEVKAQEPSIWAKGCMLGDCVSVIGLDMTLPLLDGGKMLWNIIIKLR